MDYEQRGYKQQIRLAHIVLVIFFVLILGSMLFELYQWYAWFSCFLSHRYPVIVSGYTICYPEPPYIIHGK